MDEGGKPVSYSVEEEVPDGYTSDVLGDMVGGFTIINSREEDRITIRGTKVWDDGNDRDGLRPESIEVVLYANGREEAVCETSASEGWAWQFEGVWKNFRGEPIEYRVEERPVAGYESGVSGSVEDGFVITNTHVPATTKATVRKVWEDEENLDGSRPTELVVTLSDGTKVTLNQDMGWTATVADLPIFDKGKEIVYSWSEDEVPAGYELVSTTTEGELTTLTNRHVPRMHVITYDLNGGRSREAKTTHRRRMRTARRSRFTRSPYERATSSFTGRVLRISRAIATR